MSRKYFGLGGIAWLLGAAWMLSSNSAQAAKTPDGHGHVSHTRLAPVLMHKAVPPFKGIHVYQPEPARTAKR